MWGVARALDGRVLLRIEDHDRGRSRPEFERAALEDLEWLGLDPDIGAAEELRSGPSPYRQSDNHQVYASALARLRRTARVYACDCSRREIAAEAGDPFNEETPYPVAVATAGWRSSRGAAFAWCSTRAKSGSPTRSRERCASRLRRSAATCCCGIGTGNWTYQFAVVVDDQRQQVDLVIRGEDLLSSTGRQIRLARMLGRSEPPVFLHHPLIRKPDGAKLSKSSGDTGIGELRRAGASAETVLGRAAWLTGLQEQPRPLGPGDLATLCGA